MKSLELYAQSLYDHFQGQQNCIHTVIRDDGTRYPVQPELYFRNEQQLFEVEYPILQEARGKTLVVGAGTGVHVLPLQARHFDVTALELSPQLCEIMRTRCVKKIVHSDIRRWQSTERFRTVILAGRNIGIAGSLKFLAPLLKKMLGLLEPDGQLLMDSWNFMTAGADQDKNYVQTKIKAKRYPGEAVLQIEYRGKLGEPFPWLYVNYSTLEKLCDKLSLPLERLAEDEQGNYLAKISPKSNV